MGDKDRITDTLTHITGTAFKYFKDIQDKYNPGQNTYEKKTDKEVVKLEIDKSFSGEASIARCKKAFYIYCEEFCQLAKLSGYESSSLRSKLVYTLPETLRQQIGIFKSMGTNYQAPEDWEELSQIYSVASPRLGYKEYLDTNINLYKKMFPNDLEGQSIFVKEAGKEKKKEEAGKSSKSVTTTTSEKKSTLEDLTKKPLPSDAPTGSKWKKSK
ncbi:hypothetical protein WOLCODRAFT_159113 [Wolfiporia cocos MD-104 SS10]|uniref:Uncharacterized protein n=1 Tax=Wolfiporia cocos (strain MD-104) TaxID=742152 RepID=A0A2H3JCB0_WOLCO|nr:hypothetical protein WOLCODRAFT_159113 [Wolfiporia cocos MD-104 SS10]